VLSRGTAWSDQGARLRDDDATVLLRCCVLISQDALRAMVDVRDEAGRPDTRDAQPIEGTDGVVALPSLPARLPLGALREGPAATA
jgi:hypothetical protein